MEIKPGMILLVKRNTKDHSIAHKIPPGTLVTVDTSQWGTGNDRTHVISPEYGSWFVLNCDLDYPEAYKTDVGSELLKEAKL